MERNAGIHVLKTCSRCATKWKTPRAFCPKCRQVWMENIVATAPATGVQPDQTIYLGDVTGERAPRYDVGRFNKLFGYGVKDANMRGGEGGIVQTSVTLFGGKNGGGKSTMLLHILDDICELTKQDVFLIAKEEAALEIKERALRIGVRHLGSLASNKRGILIHPIEATTDLGTIIAKRRPRMVGLDSVSMFAKTAEEQVALAETCKKFAVDICAPFILISHVNKDEEFAGFESLQHTVDTCMTIFPVADRRTKEMREVNVSKNRFGAANFEMYYRMTEHGLVYIDEDQEPDTGPIEGEEDESDLICPLCEQPDDQHVEGCKLDPRTKRR